MKAVFSSICREPSRSLVLCGGKIHDFKLRQMLKALVHCKHLKALLLLKLI